MEVHFSKWIKITDGYVSKIKHLARRKIRLSKTITIIEYDQKGKTHKRRIKRFGKREFWAYWDSYEKCFFWNNGEDGAYMDDVYDRPTHILVG